MQKRFGQLLYFFTILVVAYCDCDKFEYVPIDITINLPNNSFLQIDDLDTNKVVGADADCLECKEWYYPDNSTVYVGMDVNGVFRFTSLKDQLRYTGSCESPYYCQDGIYRCAIDNDILLLGLYNDINSAQFHANMSVSVSMTNYPVVSMHLKCTTDNYPPTAVTWFKDDADLSSSNSTVAYSSSSRLVDAPSSHYANVLILNTTSVDTSGLYRCEANSSTINDYSINAVSMVEVVPGPPEVSLIRFLNDSSIYIAWRHNTTQVNVPYNHTIVYWTNDSNYLYQEECGMSDDCVLSNLTMDISYSFVIGPGEESKNAFQPTHPMEVLLIEPEGVNVTTISLQEHSKGNRLFISWSPFLIETAVSVTITGLCSNDTVYCVNETTPTITNGSISAIFDRRVIPPGIPLTVSLTTSNVFGNGPTVLIDIHQNKSVPVSSIQLAPSVSNVTMTSVNVTWKQMRCCEFSGEEPMYAVSISNPTMDGSSSAKPIHNDLSDTHWYQFDDLKPGTKYIVTIVPVNSIGFGENATIQISTLDNITDSVDPFSTVSSLPSNVIPALPTDPQQDLLLVFVSGAVGVVILIIGCLLVCMCMMVAYCIRKPKTDKYSQVDERNGTGIELEIVNNDYQTASDFLAGTKHRAPFLIQFPTDTKATAGESVHFLVHVEGFPEPLLSWEYQGEPMTSAGPIRIFSDGTLVIHDVKIQHSGRYTFVASNPAGTVNRVVNLKVMEEDEDDEEIEKMRDYHRVILEKKPIPMDLLEKYVESHHSLDNEPFQQLFTSLRMYPDSYCFKIGTENRQRNRYKNIIPYDDNMVTLTPLPEWKEFQHTYINASYIDGYNAPKKFIATQGPTSATVSDFWRMVRQEGSCVIACLCNLHEANKVKCDRYWPESASKPQEYGPYIVRLVSEELFSNMTVRNMEILLSDGSQDAQCVKQFHFTGWPDHGIPEHGSPLVLFHEKVLNCYKDRGGCGPIIVHCSAGIGRTGTFIAYDIALDQIKAEGVVDCVAIINKLREQRQKMIQTCQQLIFLHDVILEVTLCGSTVISIAALSQTLDVLYGVNTQTGKNGFQTQFQLIQRLTPKLNTFKCTVGKKHIEKNRPNLPLPSDTRRVILHHLSNEYINASFIDGYQQKKAFIIAQSPMPQTLIDFWYMVTQQKSSVIVMLCDQVENSKVVCEQYWSHSCEEAAVFGCFSVKLFRETQLTESIVKRVLGVKNMNNGDSQTVTQIQMKHGWVPNGHCANHQAIGVLYDEITTAQQGAVTSPIIVHCSDTVTRSAMYCATHMAIDQARLEHAVDIFQIVKGVRMQRPCSIPNEENYITIHDFVKEYLTKFETYQI